MAIYVDVSAAVHHRAGLGRYAASLSRALEPLLGDRLALFYNREGGAQPPPGMENLPARTVSLGYKPWRLMVSAGQLAGIGFDDRFPDGELFHATEHLLPPFRSLPTVLTVHDLVFRHLPEHHKPLNRWFLRAMMPRFCRRADQLIAVSHFTKDDIVRSYGIPAARIRVVYEAAAPSFFPQDPDAVAAVCAAYGIPERYVLTVGTIEPRKNLSRLLVAYERARAAGLTDALVLVGRPGWLYDRFFADLARSPVRRSVYLLGFVPDEALAALYSGAQAFAMVSEYEGFGLPLVEAMACGSPAVCSNCTSLPEVAGEAALHVDPRDAASMAEALCRLLEAPVLAAELRRRGLERARTFSWQRAAHETRDVYESVLARRSGPGGTPAGHHLPGH